jgi:uncharacterized protein (TIGR02996 family)
MEHPMFSDGAALFGAICEEPWEDTPRLVYADWLQENGRPARAEFIRLQIELAHLPPHERSKSPQADRAEALRFRCDGALKLWLGTTAEVEPEWSADLPTGDGVTWGTEYARGFRSAVTFAGMKAVHAHAGAVMAASPVEDVTVMRVQGRVGVGELLALPWVPRLRALHLSGSVGASGLEALARSTHLGRLEYLDLTQAHATDAGLRVLASSMGFPNLKRLGLGGNGGGVGEEGLNALLSSLTLDRLTAVDGVRDTLSWWGNTLRIHDRFYKRFPDSDRSERN